MDALPALNGECRSQAESQSAVHHGAGISLLLTQATGEHQRWSCVVVRGVDSVCPLLIRSAWS